MADRPLRNLNLHHDLADLIAVIRERDMRLDAVDRDSSDWGLVERVLLHPAVNERRLRDLLADEDVLAAVDDLQTPAKIVDVMMVKLGLSGERTLKVDINRALGMRKRRQRR